MSCLVASPHQVNVAATAGKENDLQLWDLNRAFDSTTQKKSGSGDDDGCVFRAKNVCHDKLELRVPIWVSGIAFSPPGASDTDKKVRIGCSSGFWGDTPTAVPQLVYGGNIQYLVSDYLSEITMSLLVAARNKNPQLGFTPDFLESVAPHLAEIKRRGIRIVTNGGGEHYRASDHPWYLISHIT